MPDSIPRLKTRNGAYYATWWNAEKRRPERLSLRTKDPSEAQARFGEFLLQGAEVRGETPEDGALTCGAALDCYWQEHASQRIAAPERQEFAITNLRPHFSSLRIAAISPNHISDYCSLRTSGDIGKPSSASTHRRELSVLKAAIMHAAKTKRLDLGDVPYIALPPSAPPKDRWLTQNELTTLLDATTGRLRFFILLAYWTGSRRAAIEKLTWFQVDLKQGRIQLAQPGEAKTAKCRPTVPISPGLRPWLEQAHRLRQNEYVLDTPVSILQQFQRQVRKLGWNDVTPHTLRHTRAVHLAQKGVSLYSIAGLLGDTTQTIERNYLHHCPDHLQEVLTIDEKELAR